MKRLLVLGVGNLLLTDDGAGVHAVKDLALEEEWDQEKVDFLDGATFTQDIFYIFQEYERVLVLDTVKGGREPGTVYRFTEDNLRDNYQQRLSLHDIDLLDSLKMAELLGNKPELMVIGIEPLTISEWSMELSDPVKERYPRFLEAARREIRTLLS
ncbi:hydrogenase maturation protease [Desulfomicrobium apsheronum]|jgi:hydrogenase maturation protease|uniref:Hydrogenase maturation protease n=1 Tax=Desulfomicrobium apsheronum TaxID=52560 RepID=A0A1I3T8X6_9BACT|nr:NiFeSe hydrogenase maturation protease [Desulfomicrobium apsheronum]MDY0226589.1 HyaD/HybD family hydrogenase maturation endopeptidase [Desulfomicrobium apsheronum]SFJ67050.1 hydrogenase maturation protease [Desulfomicrobium apsheronum]